MPAHEWTRPNTAAYTPDVNIVPWNMVKTWTTPDKIKSYTTKSSCRHMRVILRVETSPDDHPAEVPEAVLPPHDEERLVEVRVVFSQLLLLDLSNSSTKQPPVNVHGATTQQRLNCRGSSRRRVNTVSFLLVLSFPGSSWSHCPLSAHCDIVLCWNAGERRDRKFRKS